MSSKVKFVLLIVLIFGSIVLFRWTPLADYLTKENVLAFLESIRSQGWGPAVFVLIYAVGCVVALPGSVLTLAGGAVFGILWGMVYNVVASNLGATLAFLTARFLGRDFVQGLLRGKKLAQFDDAVTQSGFKTIFRLRLIPLVPFNGLNFGAGLSGVRYRDYFWGSLLGMLPGTFVYTYFADSIVRGVKEASQKAYLNAVIAGVLLIFLSFLPAIYKKIKGENPRGKV